MVSPSQSESDVGTIENINNGKKVNLINSSGNRRKFACVECRQQKSKCDAHDRAPDPCTKCAKKGVPCVLKKDFRRTYKRARNEAIEKRFKELTRTLTNLSSDEILKKIEQEQTALLDGQNFTKEKVKHLKLLCSTDSNTDPMTPMVPNWGFELKNLNSPSTITEEQLKCSPKSLGDIHMSSEDIGELFHEFAKKYHPFLPVVDISKGAERIYNLSPCLFWVILLIGLRRKFGATELMTRLSALVKSVLAEITISPIIRYTPSDNDQPVLNVASVYSVQAFLLYTFWPPLTSSLSADTSWNTIGTAMFQAIRVGLNCAEFSKEYATANSELISEQVKTWVSCNVVSQIIASSFGFPAYVSFDHAVINATRGYQNEHKNHGLPSSIKQMAQIAHFENQVINTMNSNPSNALGMVGSEQKQPLLHVLNQQLSQLEINLEENDLDNIRRFLLLVAKVHLLTYYFTVAFSTHRKDEKDIRSMSLFEIESNFETKRGLVRVYNATIELLSHSTNMWQTDPSIIKYFPGVFVLNIWQSACIISKLVHSSLSTILDVARGKKAYQDAVSLTFNASVLKHDMAYRSSGIMRSIWNMFANMHEDWKNDKSNQDEKFANDFNLGINVKSRMSVSVFFDCLYILKEKCGMAKIKRETQQYEEEDYEDDNEEEEDTTIRGGKGDKNGIHERRLSRIKHPEESARKIIKTVPLDPNPINASNTSSGSSLATPNSQATDVLSLKGILNKTSPREEMSTNGYARVPNLSPQNTHSIMPGPPLSSDIANNNGGLPIATLPTILGFSQAAQEKPTNNTKISNEQLLLQEESSISKSQATQRPREFPRESPNAMMEHWDNWESDMVWKDVDLLMNEFAFNPTV